MKQSGMHRIHTFIDKHLVIPAYILSVLAGAANIAIPKLNTYVAYPTWPAWLRLSFDAITTLGILLGPDLAGVSAALRYRILSSEIDQAQRDTKNLRKRDVLVAGLRNQRRERFRDMLLSFGIATLFGVIQFSLTTAAITWQNIATQALTFFALPFVLFQLVARYEPPAEDPTSEARAIAYEAATSNLRGAGEAIRAGTHTAKHVRAVQLGMKGDINAALGQLVPESESSRTLTIREIAALLHLDYAACNRQLRRIAQRAHAAGEHGVQYDEHLRTYTIPSTQVLDLYQEYGAAGQAPDMGRTDADSARTALATKPALRLVRTGGDADMGRTPGGHGADIDAG